MMTFTSYAVVMSVKERAELIEELRRAQALLRELSGDLERATESALVDRGELTVRELAEQSGVSEDALLAFARALSELRGEGPPLGVRAVEEGVARRAALLAAAGLAWQGELGPLLDSAQVRELLGGVSRQRVTELLAARRLVGLRDRGGRLRFPAYQFVDGAPSEPLVAAFWTLADASASDWTAASWCSTPDDALEGLSPAAWAHERRDPDRLAQVARQDAARLAR